VSALDQSYATLSLPPNTPGSASRVIPEPVKTPAVWSSVLQLSRVLKSLKECIERDTLGQWLWFAMGSGLVPCGFGPSRSAPRVSSVVAGAL
jgi:hypothetical protein